MDSSLRQIEILRRVDQRVNFGDAPRLDLLRTAGAEGAKILIVAIDDRERAANLVEIARKSFPDLIILARAWDRREALGCLSFRSHRAHRVAATFRMHDHALFLANAPHQEDEAEFVRTCRAAVASLAEFLAADRDREHLHQGRRQEWSTQEIYRRTDPD